MVISVSMPQKEALLGSSQAARLASTRLNSQAKRVSPRVEAGKAEEKICGKDLSMYY